MYIYIYVSVYVCICTPIMDFDSGLRLRQLLGVRFVCPTFHELGFIQSPILKMYGWAATSCPALIAVFIRTNYTLP